MDKIIFLDIDGVLNCNKTFDDTKGIQTAYYIFLKNINDKKRYEEKLLQGKLLEIDNHKLSLLKYIIHCTGAKIVVTSSWKNFRRYSLIEEFLINAGLPIIGATKDMGSRGKEIKTYITENNIREYIIIDDEVFPDFSEEQKYNLIWTNFYEEGLTEENVNEAIRILTLKN